MFHHHNLKTEIGLKSNFVFSKKMILVLEFDFWNLLFPLFES
jgi:hypothetical protein